MHTHKVQYYETDKMGTAHHSNYVRWMEEARIAFLEENGWNYAELEKAGVFSPVLEIRCSYQASGKIQYVLNQEGASFLDTVYAEDVSFTIAVPLARTEEYMKKITEAASGAASVSDLGPLFYLEDGSSARIYEF